MRPIFLDDGVDELLRGRPSSEHPHAALEIRHQGQRIVDQIPPLDGRVPHLPTCKLPAERNRADCEAGYVFMHMHTHISTVLSNTPTVTTKVHLNSSHSVFFLLLVKTHYRIQKLLSLEEVTIAT